MKRGDGIFVRAARASDIPAVLALWARAWDSGPRPGDDDAALGRLLEHDAEALLVAAGAGDQVIGTLIATWDGWRGEMYRLAVAPERRREGVARLLVEAGHERLRRRGARRVTALVPLADDRARASWESFGYRLEVEWARYAREA